MNDITISTKQEDNNLEPEVVIIDEKKVFFYSLYQLEIIRMRDLYRDIDNNVYNIGLH